MPCHSSHSIPHEHHRVRLLKGAGASANFDAARHRFPEINDPT